MEQEAAQPKSAQFAAERARASAAQLVLERALGIAQFYPQAAEMRAALQGSRLFEIAALSREEDAQELRAILGKLAGEPEAATQKPDSPSAALSLAQRQKWAHEVGELLDVVRGLQNAGTRSGDRNASRRAHGSYFTPRAVAQSLLARSLSGPAQPAPGNWLICDPAVGGGAFLIEAVVALVERQGEEHLEELLTRVHGADLDELSLAVCQVALYFLLGRADAPLDRSEQFVVGNALLDDTWAPLAAAQGRASGELPQFDWLVGNPPWVGFQGRAAQSISPELKQIYRKNFSAFRGYPSLHGLFVERAAQLSSGLVSLLLPSSVSDLAGYTNARAAFASKFQVAEPLLEYGQDAFAGVTQPCFGLVGVMRQEPISDEGRSFRLEERSRAGARALEVEAPAVLQELSAFAPFEKEIFRELGFQSNPKVRAAMFLRAAEPEGEYQEPMLEGRVVSEFQVREARLWIRYDEAALKSTRCRFRPIEEYQECPILVRQTASFPIAARSNGLRFRNSLIAAYPQGEWNTDLLVAVLNSSLLRALHLSRQRDARQATFPQVKLAHLRALPAPPPAALKTKQAAELSALSASISARSQKQEGKSRQSALSASERRKLNQLVLGLYGLPEDALSELDAYLLERAPLALGISRRGK